MLRKSILTILAVSIHINYTHKTVPDFIGDNITVGIDLITRAIDVK